MLYNQYEINDHFIIIVFQLESLLKMLQSDDIACQKNACFAISCLATNTLGHSRILNNDHSNCLFSSMPKMLTSSDEESVWFAAM